VVDLADVGLKGSLPVTPVVQLQPQKVDVDVWGSEDDQSWRGMFMNAGDGLKGVVLPYVIRKYYCVVIFQPTIGLLRSPPISFLA